MKLDQVVNLKDHHINDLKFQQSCKHQLDEQGALSLTQFLSSEAIDMIIREGNEKQQLAFYSQNSHNVYLKDSDPEFSMHHPRNKQIQSSKGCITDDQISEQSPLRTLYDSESFRTFLASVFGLEELHNYADPLSSINLHYASEDQELGWHFDESSFAITLLIQAPEAGGTFEYIEDLRDADKGEMNYEGVAEVFAGKRKSKVLEADAGTLTLFRGRNALHRVTPVKGDTTRMLVVLAYNSLPNIGLSESARMTFYGRL